MISKAYNSKGFQTALPWLTVLIGGLTLAYGSFGTFQDTRWSEFYLIFGKTLLTGGVFAVLLKSMQFMGIFKDEITKVIYDPKYLSNRIDLPEIWQKVSTVLFKNKFPKISEKLLKDVKEIYLPTKEVSYYDNAEHQLEFRIIDKEQKTIKIIDIASLDVVCESKDTKTIYEFGYSKDNVNEYKLLKFSIDGNSEPKTEITQKLINKVNFEIVKSKLTGKEKYTIEKSSERKICLKEDNISAFNAKKIFNKLKIQIHHDEDIELNLKKSGTLSEFVLKKSNPTFKEFYIEGLIYPEQGYYVVLKIK